jgi:hypothetical protein
MCLRDHGFRKNAFLHRLQPSIQLESNHFTLFKALITWLWVISKSRPGNETTTTSQFGRPMTARSFCARIFAESFDDFTTSRRRVSISSVQISVNEIFSQDTQLKINKFFPFVYAIRIFS